jgi:hypothetical protein
MELEAILSLLLTLDAERRKQGMEHALLSTVSDNV